MTKQVDDVVLNAVAAARLRVDLFQNPTEEAPLSNTYDALFSGSAAVGGNAASGGGVTAG